MRKHGQSNLRIRDEHQTPYQMAEAIAGGNIGGFTASLTIAAKAAEIYPDGLGPFGPLYNLDMMGIWDEDVYILQACIAGVNRTQVDPFKTLCLLAAVNCGIISEQDLKGAIEQYKRSRTISLDVPAIIAQVLANNDKLRAYHEAHPATPTT